MFDDSRPEYNGELLFYQKIKPNIKSIFDIGCRNDSEFMDFYGEVHYFDPKLEFIEEIKTKKNLNCPAYFQPFGLGNKTEQLFYYPRFQTFHDRIPSCFTTDAHNKILLPLKRADEYMMENNISSIDFVKIDTEGHELAVLQGFGDRLKDVGVIQFEYGGNYKDSGVKLNDVIEILKSHGFHQFAYLTTEGDGFVSLIDTEDHFFYCNIVCINKNYKNSSIVNLFASATCFV